MWHSQIALVNLRYMASTEDPSLIISIHVSNMDIKFVVHDLPNTKLCWQPDGKLFAMMCPITLTLMMDYRTLQTTLVKLTG